MSNENKLRREALSTITSPRGNFFVVKIKDDNLKDAKLHLEIAKKLDKDDEIVKKIEKVIEKREGK